MRKYALLVGNGLNRASNNKAWVDMLEEIRKKYDVEASGAYINLPLEFERMYLEALSSNKAKGTYALKQDIVGYIHIISDCFWLYCAFCTRPKRHNKYYFIAGAKR